MKKFNVGVIGYGNVAQAQIGAREGLQTHRLILAADLSAEEGRPVRMEEAA